MQNSNLTKLVDLDLVASFRDLVMEERECVALQLEYLAELDRRKLFFHYASLRAYLVSEFGMEEWNAERRIRAARLLKRLPELKNKLAAGSLNLTLLELGQGCAHREKLSDPELLELLEAISGMSCRAAMREIASRYPKTGELPKDKIRPLNDELSEVRFVAPQALLDQLEEIRGLLAHSHSSLTMAELIGVLAEDFCDRHHPAKKAARAQEREAKKKSTELVDSPTVPQVQATHTEAPKDSGNNRVPSQSIVNALIQKTGYCCSYLDPLTSQRCTSSFALEIDHIVPWSLGGKTELGNVRFLCTSHHARISFQEFGEPSKYFHKKRDSGKRATGPLP